MVKYYFETLSKAELQEMQRRSNNARRTPELQKAWSEQSRVQQLYYDDIMTPKEIAKKYNINIRQVYRIIGRPQM